MFPGSRGTLRLGGPRSVIGRVFAVLFSIGAIIIGLMFSAVVLAMAVVVGLMVGGWLWWKMRRVLRQVRQDPRFQQFQDMGARPSARPGDDKVIEGEVLHEEWKDERSGRR